MSCVMKFVPKASDCGCGCTTQLCLTGIAFDLGPTSGVKYTSNLGSDYAGLYKTNGSKSIGYTLYNDLGNYVLNSTTGASGAGQGHSLYACVTMPTDNDRGHFYLQPLGCFVPTGVAFDCGHIYGNVSAGGNPFAGVHLDAFVGSSKIQSAITDSNGNATLSGLTTELNYVIKASGSNYKPESISIPSLYCNANVSFFSGISPASYTLTCSTGNYNSIDITPCVVQSGTLYANYDCSKPNCFTCDLLTPFNCESGTAILPNRLTVSVPWGTTTMDFVQLANVSGLWRRSDHFTISPTASCATTTTSNCECFGFNLVTHDIGTPITYSSGECSFALECGSVSGLPKLMFSTSFPTVSYSKTICFGDDSECCTTCDAPQGETAIIETYTALPIIGPDGTHKGLSTAVGQCFTKYQVCSQCVGCDPPCDNDVDPKEVANFVTCKLMNKAELLLNCNSSSLSPADLVFNCNMVYNGTQTPLCSGFSPSTFTATITS